MNEKRSIESCMFQVLKEEEINLARKEGAIAELTKLNNAFFDSDSGKHIKVYIEKRLKELKGVN